MAFNSYGFALLFLPIVFALYRLAAVRRRPGARLCVVIAAGVVFYALACAWALPVLLISLAGNYAVARRISATQRTMQRGWLIFGVTANVAALVIYKFTGFFGANLALVMPGFMAAGGAGSRLWRELALPLGISFFTFQQISLLVDVARGLVPQLRPLTYLASILFFPYLVSGPITYYREFAPQIEAEPRDWLRNGITGITLFSVGLFKKAVLADSLILWVDPMFADVAAGKSPVTVQAWVMVVGFLLQMYFDFSGYSDMAAGVARLFGVRLPLNFYSPMRVTSIMDWWRRWHMSLGRFVNDYIFQSLALPMTRKAVMRGYGRWGVTVLGVLVPTAVSMLVIGAWHGGRWTYIVFGLLHAAYMVVAETWLFWRKKNRKRKGAAAPSRLDHVRGHALTILCVLVALVPFRTADMASALRIWGAMAGLDGAAQWLSWPVMAPVGAGLVAVELVVALFIVYALPNTAQLLDRLEPSLPFAGGDQVSRGLFGWRWRAGLGWGLVTGAALMLGLTFVSRGANSFVYFSF